MFALFLVIGIFSLATGENFLRKRELNEDDELRQFSNFQDKFKKSYDNFEEMESRFNIFRDNLRKIAIHNLDRSQNFTMGVNQFADLTPEEFKTRHIGSRLNAPLGSYGCGTFTSTSSSVPVSMDWRNKGAVNPVRDQGQCGSCWAFATTANAESVWAISTGQLLDLSEEYLVDCATGLGYFNMGCNGGQPDSAFKYMINNGQCYESSYPYTAGVTKVAGSCQKCSAAPVHFSKCYDVPSGNQLLLKEAVANQPVAVAIEADTTYFQLYSGGILTSSACKTNLDHAVEIVGYGEENGVKYWNVRNSWGNWGESGYVRILRSDSTNDIGVCGIASEPSFLVV